MKKVKFYTLGCKVNQYESEALREQLLAASFSQSNGSAVDLYVINTCTVTHHADSDARRLIRKAIKDNPKAQIVVTGCYVEKDEPAILEISDKIKILPNQQKHQIVDFLNSNSSKLKSVNKDAFISLEISDFRNHQRAFVKIQDGCNNSCAYCKVPLVRGASRSRPLLEIVQEAKTLIEKGFKEIVLTGICLGDYHYQDVDLPCVLDAIDKIEGNFRIRLSSIEPHLINDALIDKVASFNRVCPHFHIPLQSGDNDILKSMRRPYTQDDFLRLIAKIKSKVKRVAITTDVLVGFPAETERNFRNTTHCLKKILPLRTHIFSFSPRRGTRAFDLKRQVDPKIVKERAYLLQDIASKCSYKYRRHFLGKELNVLVESQPDKKTSLLCGYSENYVRVMIKNATEEHINDLVRVKIKKVDNNFTIGHTR